MKYTKKSYLLQKSPSGESTSIASYDFKGQKPGPKIYLQANLHGPEVFGTALLGKLINYLNTVEDFPGQITIVPCANPVAIKAVGYNGQIGRWNVQNGTNWNRIFSIDKNWSDPKQHKNYYTDLLNHDFISIEDKLAAQLSLLSHGSTHIIDLHTSGVENESHLFTFSYSHDVFAPLGAKVHIEESAEYGIGAFDESHVIPFMDSMQKKDLPNVCTWELHHHNHIDKNLLDIRLKQLINYLQNIWKQKYETKKPEYIIPISNVFHLTAPMAGYVIWNYDVGAEIKKGQAFAAVYQPADNTLTEIKAPYDFVLLSKYGVHAISEGEQIGWVGKISN